MLEVFYHFYLLPLAASDALSASSRSRQWQLLAQQLRPRLDWVLGLHKKTQYVYGLYGISKGFSPIKFRSHFQTSPWSMSPVDPWKPRATVNHGLFSGSPHTTRHSMMSLLGACRVWKTALKRSRGFGDIRARISGT